MVLPATVLTSTLFSVSFVACSKSGGPSPSRDPATPTSAAQPIQPAAAGASPLEAMIPASPGRPAPDFELADLEGKTVHLRDFKGKTVVLEWFNPGCPFVQKSHTKGSLALAADHAMAKGVVWLAINSAAEGRQGSGVDANRAGASALRMKYPVLLDSTGKVGKAYGASNTPHMFVVNPGGILVYKGAIDNSPDGEGESPTGGKLVNYVDAALAALAAGKPPDVAETKAYGCSVKY